MTAQPNKQTKCKLCGTIGRTLCSDCLARLQIKQKIDSRIRSELEKEKQDFLYR